MLRFSFGLVLFGFAGWFSDQVQADPPDLDRYQIYELKYKDVTEAEAVLTDMLEGFKDSVDIVVDAKSNRLLVSGPEKAQRVATKVLKKLDQPPEEEKSSSVESVVKTYPCPKSKFNLVAEKLRERYADVNGVRIAGDAAGERLLILAPPDIHHEIQTLFAADEEEIEDSPKRQRAQPRPQTQTANTRETPSARRKPAPAQPERIPAKVSAVKTASADDEQFIELLHVHPDVVAPFLRKLLGPHWEAVASSKTQFRVTNNQLVSVDVTIDRKRNGIRLSGDPELGGQVASIIQSLDDPSGTGSELTRALPLQGIDPEKVQEVQNALRLEARRAASSRGKPKTSQRQSQRPSVSHANYTEESEQLGTIRLIGNQEPSQNRSYDGTAGIPAVDPADAPDDDARDLKKELRKISSDLEIDVLPDLDVVILRGSKAEVQEMTRILKDLERLSIETEPQVEIYPLKHVRGESLAALIEKVNTDLTGGLRGKITITPLVKPNALLIIGWGETVTSVRQLIEKLDQPIPADVQFQVFRLKHADATPARTTVQEFFTARTPAAAGTGTSGGPGLAPRVQVTADTRTNSLIVQAPPRDMQEAAELILQLDVPGGAVVHQARIFKLKNTLAADVSVVLQSAIDAARGGAGAAAANHKSSMLEFLTVDKEGQQILKSGVMGDVKVTADLHTNSLLVSASPESMELIAALIRRLDETPTDGAQIKVFRVVNGDATSLVQMLRSLLPPAGPGGAPQLANSRDESSLVPTRFSVDLRTNSIIATGSTGDLRIVEALLFRLDQRDVEQRKNTVYRLKNAPSADVAKSVNDFLRSERTVQQAAPGAISPFQQIESEVVVVSEPVSNSLIISATPRFFDEILVLVEKLDAQPPQVMIQCLIAQITLNNTNEFGVELGLQDSLLFDRSLLSNLVTTPANTSTVSTPSGIVTSTVSNIVGATLTPGFNFNGQPLGNNGSSSSISTAGTVAGQATSNFGVGTTNQQLGYGGLVLSASSENVSVLLRALQQSSRLEVLSRPLIRTLDNQPAFIQIGQRVPRIVSASVTQVGSVNGVTLENVGLILGVTPRISPDGMVVMEVDAENSSVDVIDQGIPVSVSASGTVIRSPIFNITTASTTVSANSGETIIIGGLIVKNTNETKRRIPLLSDVPVLGNFFRYDSSVISRSELLIILTPYVIRSPEESARLKREEVAKMHWCAGDVMELYGPGIVSDDTSPFAESNVPVIYPDANPRGTIQVPEIPPEPSQPALPPQPSDAARGQIGGDAETAESTKNKKSGRFPFLTQKKTK